MRARDDSMQIWDPDRYATHARFVSDLGAPVVELLDPRPGERVLDLGCGDGALTQMLVAAGCRVVAVDASPEQVRAARDRGLEARVADATALGFDGEFDAVFSNAVLHWIRDPDAALRAVHRALAPGGRLVAELGGHGCVASIRAAFGEVLARRGIDAERLNPWYFPTAEEYRERLDANGFDVNSIRLFPRPTPLPSDVIDWLETFAQPFLAGVPNGDRAAVLSEMRERLEPVLRTPDGGWIADYVRLRFAATRRTAPAMAAAPPAPAATRRRDSAEVEHRSNAMRAAPASPAATTPPRSWVWGFGRLAVHAYYKVERIGGALPTGALLLVANHPNTLIDPAVIQTTAGRRIRFLAKSTLFAWHPLSPLVRRSGAIPVYRRIDPGVDTSRNVEMFAAVAASLAAGEAICLFPEGTSHARGRLEPLRTGAARMALDGCAGGRPVTIVPVGLNFDALARFRSRVTVVFGRPVEHRDLAMRGGDDRAAAVRALTDRIEKRLRHLLVEAEPRHDLPIVERIDRLYSAARGASRDARARLGRRRLIAAGMARLRERDPARLAEIMTQVEDYLSSLARFGLRERDLDQRIPAADVVRFALREGLLALLLGPVALAGIVAFAAPYWLTDRLGRWAPNLQSRAVWQIIGGGLIHATWIMAIAATAGARNGAPTGVTIALGLVVLAVLGTLAVERESAVWRTTRAFFALRQMPLRARGALRRRRAALAEVLDDVRAWVDDKTRY